MPTELLLELVGVLVITGATLHGRRLNRLTNLFSRPVRADPELLHLFRELPHHLPKPRPFGRRNPFQAKAFFLDAEIGKHQLDRIRAFLSFVITLLIVAISRMTATDEDAVRPFGEGINDQVGMHQRGGRRPSSVAAIREIVITRRET